MGTKAKAFIPYTLDIGFENNANKKEDIQRRIGDNTEINFLDALNNIDGDSKESKGENFNEVVLQALAYFFKEIFPERYQIKDAYWNVQTVKGFFDACNLTPYTPIDEVVTTHFPLQDKALFAHCYLVIQTAWFFNSGKFGSHQYLTYTAEYARNGTKLPMTKYKYDKGHLKQSYSILDERKRKGTLPKGEIGYYYVKQWYYSVLYLIVTELGLSNKHFIVTHTKSREYNPVIKAPRILRWETPFLLTHVDIKSAYPSFLDAITGSNIAPTIYERVAKANNKTRSEAKVLFLVMLNSGQKDYWKKDKAIKDLIGWGYTAQQAEHVTAYTHDKSKSFTEHMSEIEEEAIHAFTRINSIEKYVRLHDAILYLDKKQPNHIFEFENGKIKLETEHPKKPNLNETFGMGNRRLPYGYVASIPDLKNLIRRTAPSGLNIKGEIDGFRFFHEKYHYYSAIFNLNEDFDLKTFLDECKAMFNALYALNGRKATSKEIEAIVRHIRAYSNVCFQDRNMYKTLIKINSDATPTMDVKERDWEMYENLRFGTKIKFLNALNAARKKVNQIYCIKLIKKRLIESYEVGEYNTWIEFGLPKRNNSYKLAYVIASRINYLRTNRMRKPKAQIDNGEPLYSNTYKEPRLYAIEPQKSKFANIENIVRRRIKKYEGDLRELIRRESEIKSVEQYFSIIDSLINESSDFGTVHYPETIQKEKEHITEQMEAEDFEDLVLIKAISSDKVENHIPSLEDFTDDMSNSIFNQIDEERAFAMGILDDYERFHRLNKHKKTVI